MKKILSIIVFFTFSFGLWAQQQDTMFIHTKLAVHEFAVTDVDSISPKLGSTQNLDSIDIYRNNNIVRSFRVENIDSIIFTRVKFSQSELTYEDYLGTYTMWFTVDHTAPRPQPNGALRQRRTPVTLEQATYGSTYYLKGLLGPNDGRLGDIIVTFNPETRGLEIRGQKLFNRASEVYWLSPEGISTANANVLSNPTNAQGRGVVSANYSISGGLKFEMVHLEGTWSTNRATGFRFENFPNDASTSNGTLVYGPHTGTHFQRHNYLIFEKDLDAEHEHDFQQRSTTAPTCEKQGFDLYVCRHCWLSKRETIVALGTPQNLQINGTTLSWNTVVDSEVSGYIVSINGTQQPKTTGVSFDLSTLAPGVYTIKVKATSNGPRDADCWSEIYYVTGGTQLSAPTNLQISGTTLTWNSVESAVGYEIFINNCNAGTYTTGNSFDLSFLSAGTYTIRIAANGNGETIFHSTWSAESVIFVKP